jgi:SHS2 domain-containing protein
MQSASFEILEHTADIGIRATAPTLEDLFAAAAMALQTIAIECAAARPGTLYPMAASGEDLESLLVNWLNEVVYFIDGRRVVLSRFDVKSVTDTEVIAEAWGEPQDPARHPMQLVVKAATYHQLKIARQEAGWTADVYLDI